MLKLSILFTLLLIALFSFGCGSSGPANSANTAAANSNGPVKMDPANMPEGLNPQQVQPSANSTPGIPPTVTNLPKGATPTPGIPSPEEMKKGLKPGLTPTPGIPSQEELRKAMGQKPTGTNVPPPPPDQPMMKKNTNKIQKPQ